MKERTVSMVGFVTAGFFLGDGGGTFVGGGGGRSKGGRVRNLALDLARFREREGTLRR